MLKSMTGYGRCFKEADGFTMTWEIRSVNGRHLDVKWRLPLVVRAFEAQFEKVVRKFASRGRVDISLNLSIHKAELQSVSFNTSQAQAMIAQMSTFASSQGMEFTPDFNKMLSMSFLWDDAGSEPDKAFLAQLEEGLSEALSDWNEARSTEAKALEADMRERLARMEEWAALIETNAPAIKEAKFEALRERINEVLARNSLAIEEQRFLQEISLLSDKLDISEEITRMKAHIVRLQNLLSDGGDAGKRLDFTLQECFREINTCGNKVQDPNISRVVVDFKNELEKCREQVQNLE